MNYTELRKILSPWKPVFALERTFSKKARNITRAGLSFLVITSFAITLLQSGGAIQGSSGKSEGLLYFSISLWLVLFLLDCFHYSHYFKRSKAAGRFGLELALIVFSTSLKDVTKGFVTSSLGREILIRSGIDVVRQKKFLSERKNIVSADKLKLTDTRSVFRSYLSALLAADTEFRNFILSHNITEEEFLGAGSWSASASFEMARLKRWWSRENLLKTSPIGRSWSYGKSYSLMKYAKPLYITTTVGNEGYHSEEAKLLEIILSRASGANAVLVGEDGSGKMEVLEELHRMMEKGEAAKALEDKEIWVFEPSLLAASTENAEVFERELLKVMRESERAGNIIFVIPNLSKFLEAGNRYSISVLSTLSPFISSSKLQIVGVSNIDDYERSLEHVGDIKQQFEKVSVRPVDENHLVGILRPEVLRLERELGATITYPAVSEAIVAAKKYFVDRPLADAASDLLVEAAAKASKTNKFIILKEDVLATVGSKTGIPTGKVDEKEKEKLLNLEGLLKSKIVGQDEAVKAVSDAIRRARSGIGNPMRPMGSFLFLGPTGVGKTETAKALGEVFFGERAKFLRLDMSEYNAADSLNRLIGSFESNTPGTLVSLLRENPYGVLLLDEFEKTAPKVLDLFLQIIDEGIFSDMRGDKVGARNVVIVATSNAGSDIIFEYLKTHKDLSGARETIINKIIAEGVYKPELLNRFDGVILFHPLAEAHLREVAKKMLKGLEGRLKEKGITLKTSDALINFLVQKGTDPKFGARPLNRAIQETVEQIIAKKMISGEVSGGSTVELTDKDFE